MKLATTLILTGIIMLATLLLIMNALGVSLGVRVGGNIFADEGPGSLRPPYLILLILAAAGGLYLVWQRSRDRV